MSDAVQSEGKTSFEEQSLPSLRVSEEHTIVGEFYHRGVSCCDDRGGLCGVAPFVFQADGGGLGKRTVELETDVGGVGECCTEVLSGIVAEGEHGASVAVRLVEAYGIERVWAGGIGVVDAEDDVEVSTGYPCFLHVDGVVAEAVGDGARSEVHGLLCGGSANAVEGDGLCVFPFVFEEHTLPVLRETVDVEEIIAFGRYGRVGVGVESQCATFVGGGDGGHLHDALAASVVKSATVCCVRPVAGKTGEENEEHGKHERYGGLEVHWCGCGLKCMDAHF